MEGLMGKPGALSILKTFSLTLLFFSASSISSLAEDGWNVSLGSGVYAERVYMGSDQMYASPALLIQGSYFIGDFSMSLDLIEGPRVVYTNQERAMMLRFGASFDLERDSRTYSVFGNDRDHSSKTREFLRDTPTVTTAFAPEVSLHVMTQWGGLGLAAAYHPTSVDYSLPGQVDEELDGWLYSLSFSKEYPITSELLFSVMGELSYMNNDYARAWFSVEYATPVLPKFAAEAGFRDISLGLQVTKKLSARASAALLLAGTRLLGDAADTPYTVDPFQPAAMLTAFYTF